MDEAPPHCNAMTLCKKTGGYSAQLPHTISRGDEMVGQLVWCEGEMPLEFVEVEGLRMLRGGFPQSGFFYRLRLGRYLRKMRRQGVRRMVVPRDFSWWSVANHQGISRVDVLPFLRRYGGELMVLSLKKGGYDPKKCTVALRGTRVGRDMIAVADSLVPWVRDISISAPHGGESLQNLLRREWGLAVRPDGERVEGVIRFDSGAAVEGGVVLSLFGGEPQLGGLEANLVGFPPFSQVEPLSFLAVLWESGKLARNKLEFYLT